MPDNIVTTIPKPNLDIVTMTKQNLTSGVYSKCQQSVNQFVGGLNADPVKTKKCFIEACIFSYGNTLERNQFVKGFYTGS